MAANNVTPAVTRNSGEWITVAWNAMIADSTGLEVQFMDYDLTGVYGSGTWDTSGTVTLQFSLDGTNWISVPDSVDESAIIFSANAYKMKAPQAQGIKWRVLTTANGATAAINVNIVALFRRR